jgi:hypothetical protein
VAEYDPTEFIGLCASILDDGEITSDEAYHLANWLNDHPDAASNWPGNELVKPLQAIWADGSVNRRELHRLARLLISIQREWARCPQTEISSLTDDAIPKFLEANLDEVRLPSLRGKFQVPSQNEPGRFYEVDLSGPSCTCPDWRAWRSRLPVGDLTRCCKHVLHAYAKLARRGKSDGWLLAFIENGWPAHPGAEWHLLTLGSDKVLFSTASDKGWANVFAKEGREYLRFGFNVDENRWAYGSEPHAAQAIADAVASCGKAHSQRRGFVNSGEERGASADSSRFQTASATEESQLRETKRASVSDEKTSPTASLAFVIIAVLFSLGVILFAVNKANTITFAGGKANTNHDRQSNLSATTNIAAGTTVSRHPQFVTITQSVSLGEDVHPAGTRFEFISQQDTDVHVRYRGTEYTIPLSATDLK